MKSVIALAATLVALAAPFSAAARPIDLGEDPARAIAGKELPADEPRVAQARAWIEKVAAATGESEEQVAASAMKLARFIFDALKVRALPLEALEAVPRAGLFGRAWDQLRLLLK
ncbi:MAG: hypothetical protein N2690_04195 [Rhodocyclaceae bacterium]|nr:hypothetical protein [Rhodocyclaceae bacterium]